MLIDSHCHLPHTFEAAKVQVDEAMQEGVVELINIGTSIVDSQKALDIASQFSNVYATAAVYPHENIDKDITTLKAELTKLLNTKKFIAIGECGIDLSEGQGGRRLEDQIPVFDMQIQLAIEHNLPLILHIRNGDETVLKLLEKYKSHGLTGVVHCFSASWEVAQKYLDLNFYLGFGGRITYPSRRELLETVKNVPIDKFLVETDSPYLPPQGHRGEKNMPKYVKIVAQKVGDVKNIDFDTTCNHAYKNTHKLLNLG